MKSAADWMEDLSSRPQRPDLGYTKVAMTELLEVQQDALQAAAAEAQDLAENLGEFVAAKAAGGLVTVLDGQGMVENITRLAARIRTLADREDAPRRRGHTKEGSSR